MPILWERLNSNHKDWRIIVKSLELLEYLVRAGAESVADEARDRMFQISTLQKFHYIEENRDRGSGIRERSKMLCDLLSDRQRLDEVRKQAADNKGKFISISNDGTARSSYGSYAYDSEMGRYDRDRDSDRAKEIESETQEPRKATKKKVKKVVKKPAKEEVEEPEEPEEEEAEEEEETEKKNSKKTQI